MSIQKAQLLDPNGNRIAKLEIEFSGDRFDGVCFLEGASPRLINLFSRFEEIVEGQTFSLLDEIENEIDSEGFRVRFEMGSEVPVQDLQVYPSTGFISFKTAQVSVVQ